MCSLNSVFMVMLSEWMCEKKNMFTQLNCIHYVDDSASNWPNEHGQLLQPVICCICVFANSNTQKHIAKQKPLLTNHRHSHIWISSNTNVPFWWLDISCQCIYWDRQTTRCIHRYYADINMRCHRWYIQLHWCFMTCQTWDRQTSTPVSLLKQFPHSTVPKNTLNGTLTHHPRHMWMDPRLWCRLSGTGRKLCAELRRCHNDVRPRRLTLTKPPKYAHGRLVGLCWHNWLKYFVYIRTRVYIYD